MRIAILGSGGHGWQSLNQYITSVDHEIDFWYLPVDWGGFTGLFGRLMEKENRQFNSKIHNKIVPVFPWGDVNRLIAFFLEYNFTAQLRDNFELRHNLIKAQNEHLLPSISSNLIGFCEELKIDKKTMFEAIAYLGDCLDEINSFYLDLNHPYTKGSISNFWHNYLFAKEPNMYSFNHFYQKNGILPYNISVNFVGKDRFILSGFDQDNQLIVGEELIDTNNKPIKAETFFLENIEQEVITENDITELTYRLKLTDYIIIPNGSIANWLPLVNIPSIALLLKEKSEQGKLIAFMNLFHTSNEFQYSYYIKYLSSLGISPLLIGPRLQHIILNKKIIEAYQQQNKFLNHLENMEAERYLGCLDIVTQEENPEIEGVKYTSSSITKILNLLIR